MGDMGDMYRDWNAAKKEKKSKRESYNLKIIDQWIQKNIANLQGYVKDGGGIVYFRIEDKPKIDFYPTVNKWRKGKVIYYGDAAKFFEWYEKQKNTNE